MNCPVSGLTIPFVTASAMLILLCWSSSLVYITFTRPSAEVTNPRSASNSSRCIASRSDSCRPDSPSSSTIPHGPRSLSAKAGSTRPLAAASSMLTVGDRPSGDVTIRPVLTSKIRRLMASPTVSTSPVEGWIIPRLSIMLSVPIPSSTLCILFSDRISENCIELPDHFIGESLRILDGLSPEPASPFVETTALE